MPSKFRGSNLTSFWSITVQPEQDNTYYMCAIIVGYYDSIASLHNMFQRDVKSGQQLVALGSVGCPFGTKCPMVQELPEEVQLKKSLLRT